MEEKMIAEVCPHCDREQYMRWDVEEQGYEAYCPSCGGKMLICSECMNETADCNVLVCDWSEEEGRCRRCRNG